MGLCPVHRALCDERALSVYHESMPTGLKRFQSAESLHSVTFSCFHRLPLLEAPCARETVESVLERARARHQAAVFQQ